MTSYFKSLLKFFSSRILLNKYKNFTIFERTYIDKYTQKKKKIPSTFHTQPPQNTDEE